MSPRSATNDFSGVGVDGLSAIVNFVAAFDGRLFGDAQEVDVTLDYKVKQGLLQSFWLRVRGSWLNEELTDRNGTDVRVILGCDFPVI